MNGEMQNSQFRPFNASPQNNYNNMAQNHVRMMREHERHGTGQNRMLILATDVAIVRNAPPRNVRFISLVEQKSLNEDSIYPQQ